MSEPEWYVPFCLAAAISVVVAVTRFIIVVVKFTMHIVPLPVVRAACHFLANVDKASAVALRANEVIVSHTIDTLPQLSQLSIFTIHEFDKLGTLAIAITMWLIENAI